MAPDLMELAEVVAGGQPLNGLVWVFSLTF